MAAVQCRHAYRCCPAAFCRVRHGLCHIDRCTGVCLDPALQKQKVQPQLLEKQPNNLVFAADAWRKANKLAGNKCMECYGHTIGALADTGDAKRFFP